ncbi:uncharacterized protein B4U79_11635 [Dinothrombium tinctorium]|uniref:Ig-like domain-containing protein n=1 Tax=Dinothrombium tinctorium TaxID=1965070 RepID=A0A3S3PVZ0_9ACAR|nr:uncharacterized protein B4U79_11635 [Dinothrombium tinctorium]
MNKTVVKMFFGLILFFISVKKSNEIRLVSVSIPEFVFVGKSAILSCNYDTENDRLYSLKWFFNGNEFLAYLPQESDPLRYYALPQVSIDLERSKNGKRIYLKNISISSEGIYRCEVSADKSFQTEALQSFMFVVVPAKHKPIITNRKKSHKIGDLVNMTCMASETKPASQLLWFINGKQVLEHFILRKNKSSATLIFQIQANHIQNGKIRVKCKSAIYRGVIFSLIQVVKSFFKDADAKIAISRAEMKPMIHGHKDMYKLGEKVELFCSHPNPEKCPYSIKQHVKENSISLKFYVLPCHLIKEEMLNIGCQATKQIISKDGGSNSGIKSELSIFHFVFVLVILQHSFNYDWLVCC